MPSEVVDVVKVFGTLALLVVPVIVLVIVVVSIVDRHPRPKSEPGNDEDA